MKIAGSHFSMFFGIFLFAISSLAQSIQREEVLKPLRQGTLRYSIVKTTFVKDSPNFETQEETVCSGNTEVNVYDLRSQPNGNFTVSMKSCTSKLADQDVTLVLGSLIAFTRGVILPEDGERDIKSFTALLWIEGAIPGTPVQAMMNQASWSLDLNEQRSGLALYPNVSFTCNEEGTSCYPSLPESFYVFVQFIDSNR